MFYDGWRGLAFNYKINEAKSIELSAIEAQDPFVDSSSSQEYICIKKQISKQNVLIEQEICYNEDHKHIILKQDNRKAKLPARHTTITINCCKC